MSLREQSLSVAPKSAFFPLFLFRQKKGGRRRLDQLTNSALVASNGKIYHRYNPPATVGGHPPAALFIEKRRGDKRFSR